MIPAAPSHRRTITLSILGTVPVVLVLLSILGTIMRPWVIGVMAAAMSGEISTQAHAQTAPLVSGFRVIIEGQIAQLEEDITRLQWRAQNNPRTWTVEDATLLLNKTRGLARAKDALAAINQPVRIASNP